MKNLDNHSFPIVVGSIGSVWSRCRSSRSSTWCCSNCFATSTYSWSWSTASISESCWPICTRCSCCSIITWTSSIGSRWSSECSWGSSISSSCICSTWCSYDSCCSDISISCSTNSWSREIRCSIIASSDWTSLWLLRNVWISCASCCIRSWSNWRASSSISSVGFQST